ncbi:uncharacterized protein FOMMEDRAFT_113608 [Fomitiporia mediterranea MF3/22]|uniref:uncharacterized protein n=1 Tax=Fomitiporia mediterranea (strain MF3/22) TaxID=694068 RepID=UPI0004409276|nr:uncharacterized protein FOMMEDRAFT_113608 [Fomitiporia mediterranea MF3/22]EJC99004.1 hypothetical protein FOMMEDRAFT_113608 [Fomitiporia mediterranea MF3/22]
MLHRSSTGNKYSVTRYVTLNKQRNRSTVTRYRCLHTVRYSKHFRAAVQLRPVGHPNRSGSLNNLAATLLSRFKQLGRTTDLDEAIEHHRAALKLRPNGHPDRPMSLNNLANSLESRFKQHGSTVDIEEAIEHHRTALRLCPHGHPDCSMFLSNLAASLVTRFERGGRPADLDEAIVHHRSALKLRPNGHPNRLLSLSNLASSLATRFEQYGQTADLDEAIEHNRVSLELCPDNHPDRSAFLNNLANSLQARFKQNGQAADLDEAIEHHRAALHRRPNGHPRRFASLNSLANCLQFRFQQHGRTADLDGAIKLYRTALELLPDSHPDRSTSLNGLAVALQRRFEQHGKIADLDEAIEHHRAVLHLRPNGHPNRSMALDNLANSLLMRYEQNRQTMDLDEAIEHHRAALQLRPDGHPERAGTLNDLASSLHARFVQNGQTVVLDEAIEHERVALDLRPDGHPGRLTSLNNLATSLIARFEQHGLITDLDEAIRCLRTAVELLPDGNPGRSTCLNNLACSLRTKFERHRLTADLDEAIEHHRTVLQLCPDGHPDHSRSLRNLAVSLFSRFKKFGLRDDFEECIQLLERAAEHKFSSLFMRLTSASQWARFARSHAHHTTSRAYKVAMLLLQRNTTVNPTLRAQHEFLKERRSFRTLALDAAAYAVEENKLGEAVEILEQGRGLLWSQMRGFRTPLDRLAETNGKLADRFRDVSLQLENLATSSPAMLSNSSAIENGSPMLDKQLSTEQEEIIGEIRQIPGLEGFLAATPFNVLQQAASEGPVIVVNHSEYRSDVLIVLSHEDLPVICLPLDEEFGKDSFELCVKLLEARRQLKVDSLEYDEILRQAMKMLWDRIVFKVVARLEELGITKGARMWWCPTSVLSALPFHAAGPFRDANGTVKYLLDDYVSSYTPSLGALASARSRENVGNPRMLIVSEPVVREPVVLIVGDTSLESADKEIRNIRSCRGVRTKVRCNASRDAVIKALRKTSWVHFACHGRLNSKPFDSAFKLSDCGLTLLDIVQANLPNAEFAFLSACHTAEQPHDGMHDEVLHLAAAMQFSGFRSVIGSMWELLDVDGPFFAKVVYEHMCSCKESEATYKRAAAGLRKAAVKLKLEGRDEIRTERWVNLIHIGA